MVGRWRNHGDLPLYRLYKLDFSDYAKSGALDNVGIPACAGMTVNEKRQGFVPYLKNICYNAKFYYEGIGS